MKRAIELGPLTTPQYMILTASGCNKEDDISNSKVIDAGDQRHQRTVDISLLPGLGLVLELLEVSLDRVGTESTPT